MGFNKSILGLRGFLALLVVLFHCYGSMQSEGFTPKISKDSYYYGLLGAGEIGVNIFFVISGYLIIQSLIRNKQLKDFYINRILRIYPVFLTIHLLVFAVGPIIGYKWMANIDLLDYLTYFISNMFLLPGVFDLPIAQLVAWSLSYEFAFYIIASLFFLKNNWLTWIGVIITGVMLFFHPRTIFFLTGVVLYIFRDNINQFVPKYQKKYYFNSLIYLILMFICYQFSFTVYLPWFLSFFFFFGVIKETGIISDLMKTNLFQYLGRVSYSLYLWHTFVMYPLKPLTHKVNQYINNDIMITIVFFIISILFSVIISHFSYELLEKKLVSTYYKRKKQKKLKVEQTSIL